MIRAALSRVSEEGEREEEVRDQAPDEEENAGQDATNFEELPPGDSSLSRILNPIRFDLDNRDDDNADIPSYNGSGDNDANSIESFVHLGSKVNKRGRRPNGRGLSDVLGRELKVPPPSLMPKVVGQKSKFVLEEDILDADIADADVTLRKEHYGVPGSSDYRKNMMLATSPLSDKFGVASHKIIVKSQDGDSASAQQIERTIMSVIRRVHEGYQQAKAMDWMDICNIPNLDKTTTSLTCSDWWDESENNIWECWDTMDYEQVLAWQYSINKRFSLSDRVASKWLKEFVYASSTDSLRSAVDKKYGKLGKNAKGGVLYLYLTLCEMFQMSKEVKNAMLTFIEFFKKHGIAKYEGENVLVAAEQLLGVCKRLDAVKALTEEHVHDILTGLSIVNNSRFKSMYKLMAEQSDLGNQLLPSITDECTPMDKIEAVLAKGTDMYDFLCHAKKWNMAKKGGGGTFNYSGGDGSSRKCFNCGKEGCEVKNCDKPLNKELIKKNCEKYYAAKNKAQGQRAGGGGDKNKNGDKKRKGKDADPVASQRKRWTAAGIQLVDNVLKVNCKECGLNSTHSSGFHAAWANDKSNFCLPDTHPFVVARAQRGNSNHTPVSAPSDTPAPSSNTLTFSRAELEAKIVDAERNSTDPNAGSLAQMMRSMFLN